MEDVDVDVSEGEQMCLICLQPESSSISATFPQFPRSAFDEFPASLETQSADDCLSAHLWSLFILRKFLRLPGSECESLLRRTFGGINPGDWCSICVQCSELAQNALQVHQQLVILSAKMEALREEAYRKLKMSILEESENQSGTGLLNEGNCLSVHSMIRDYIKLNFHFLKVRNNQSVEIEEEDENENHFNFEVKEECVDSFGGVGDLNQLGFNLEEELTFGFDVENGNGDNYVGDHDDISNRNTSDEDPDSDVDTQSPANATTNRKKCEICQKTFIGQREFWQHVKAHTKLCDRCGFSDKRYQKFVTHIQTHKINDLIVEPQDLSDTAKFTCKLCDFIGLRVHIYRHVKNDHLATEKFTCDICSRTFSGKENLRDHVRHVHKKQIRDKVKVPQEKKPKYRPTQTELCQYCEQVFGKGMDLLLHQREEHSEYFVHRCDSCDAIFKRSDSLKSHNESVHLKLSFQCHLCPVKYSCSKALKKHLRRGLCKKNQGES